MDILKNKYNFIQKMLFTITLVVILFRKYTISMVKEVIIPEDLMSILFYLSIILLGVQFFMKKKHTLKEVIVLFIASGLYILTKEGTILVIILVAVSSMEIDDLYVIKSYMVLSVFFIISVIIMRHIVPDILQQSELHYRLTSEGFIARETFGFGNPNAAFFFTLPIYASYIYIRFDEYNYIDRIILIFLTIFIYQKTMSRTGVLTAGASLLMIEIMRIIDINRHKIYGVIIKFVPIIFSMVSIITGLFFDKVEFINNILASRPRHWNTYLVIEGNLFAPFGNRYSQIVKDSHPLDNSYIYMLCILGLVAFIFFMYLLYSGLDRFVKENNKKYIAIVMMFLVYSLAENILLEAGYNFTIILLIKYVMIHSNKEWNMSIILKDIKQKIVRRRAL